MPPRKRKGKGKAKTKSKAKAATKQRQPQQRKVEKKPPKPPKQKLKKPEPAKRPGRPPGRPPKELKERKEKVIKSIAAARQPGSSGAKSVGRPPAQIVKQPPPVVIPQRSLYRCPITLCKYSSKVEDDFVDHVMVKHPAQDQYLCPYCNQNYLLDGLAWHIGNRHGNMNAVPEDTTIKQTNSQDLLMPECRSESDIKPAEVVTASPNDDDECGRSVFESNGLPCGFTTCPYVTVNEKDLREHLAFCAPCNGDVPLQCPRCKMSFVDTELYVGHSLNHLLQQARVEMPPPPAPPLTHPTAITGNDNMYDAAEAMAMKLDVNNDLSDLSMPHSAT